MGNRVMINAIRSVSSVTKPIFAGEAKKTQKVSLKALPQQPQNTESFGDKFLKAAEANKEVFPYLNTTQSAGILLSSKQEAGQKLNYVV